MSEIEARRARLGWPSIVHRVIIKDASAQKLEQKQREIEALLEGIERQQAACDRLQTDNERLKREIERLKAVGTPKAIPIQTEPVGSGPLSLKGLSRFVANEFGYGLDDIRSSARTFRIAFARQVAMYFAVIAGRTTCDIGRFWDRDHTVVLHSFRKIAGLRESNPEVAAKIADIKEKLEKLDESGPPMATA